MRRTAGPQCLAAIAILSLGHASAWVAPSFAPASRQLLSWQQPAAAAACRRGGLRSVGALRMAGEELSEAPSKGKTKGKGVVLGPGLFDPNIQVGPQQDEEQEEILLARSQFKVLFGKHDDEDGKIDRDGLTMLAKELGQEWTTAQAVQAVWKIDGDSNGFMSMEEVFDWYRDGNLSKVVKGEVSKEVASVVKDVHSLSKEDVANFFQLQDNDTNELLDKQEMTEMLSSAGFELDTAKVDDIYTKIAGEQGASFNQIYAWLSSGFDLQGVHRKFSEVIIDKSDDDKRRIFVRGFPWKVKEDAVNRYFSKRSGEVESVKMINWSRDNLPSGRSIVTFKDEAAVENAMSLHRNRMGSRWLEVYRVNQGDREEIHNVEKSLHGALIGIKGAVVQELQRESGAMIVFETEPEGKMVIKGRDHERTKAWALAKAIIQDNEMQSYMVDQTLHGRLIGAKGTLKKMMELESGAHIVYRTEPAPCCNIYGNQQARERAWQLVNGKIWDLQHASEEYFPLDKKFHGTLIGKGSVVVRALEERTGARIRFVAGKGSGDQIFTESSVDEAETPEDVKAANKDKGAMVVRGSKEQCKAAWGYAQIFLREMPLLLSELRDEDIALGALRSLPLSPAQVWKVAVEEAFEKADEKLGKDSPDTSSGDQPLMLL